MIMNERTGNAQSVPIPHLIRQSLLFTRSRLVLVAPVRLKIGCERVYSLGYRESDMH